MDRPIIGAHLNSFSEAFDLSFVLKQYLERIIGMKVPLHMCTVSKQLLDSITEDQQTTEIRLLIEISAAREAYRSY